MARRDRRADRREEARDDRQAEEARDDRQAKRKRKKGHPDKDRPKPRPKSVTERLKEKSTQSGHEAMNAAPGQRPAEPANAEAVFTSGPGQAVEYNYQRLGTYSEDYAQQQSQVTVAGNPIAGPGQTVTSGAANNPT